MFVFSWLRHLYLCLCIWRNAKEIRALNNAEQEQRGGIPLVAILLIVLLCGFLIATTFH